MVDTRSLATFMVTAFLLIVVPGPSVLFVISRGVALGRKAALLTVVGNGAGVLVQVVVVAAGLGVTTLPGLALAAHRDDRVRVARLDHGRQVLAAVHGEPPDPPATAALLRCLREAADQPW